MNKLFTVMVGLMGMLFGRLALADSIILTNKLEFKDVRVIGVKDDQLFYQTSAGNETHQPINKVAKINLTEDPAFSAAEEAYEAKDWDRAADGYSKIVATATKDWIQDWAARRLFDAASKSNRFDAAIKAFIALAEKNPDAAKTLTITPPAATSQFLTDGINLLTAAVNKTTKNPVKAALLPVLRELYRAKGDTKGMEDMDEKIASITAAMNPNSPEAQRFALVVKLNEIKRVLARKEFDAAIKGIDALAADLNDPALQADALLLLADARNGKTTGSKEPNEWKEVVIAYMRVPAHAPGTPQAAAALLRAAGLLETQLNDKETALKLYQQIMTDFKDQEPAKAAQKEFSRLKQG